MMKMCRPIIFIMLLLAYSTLFVAQDTHTGKTQGNISPALPTGVLNVLGHSYMNQIIAESLFIKTAVYLGGLDQQMDEANLTIMGQHFITISQLHPKFLDTYYRSESVLAHRGDQFVHTANTILEHGRTALPNEVAIPFFEGFNYFHYLNQPAKAGEILRIASNIPDAPKWIGHLASMLMASGGNIRTGLIWLNGMLAASHDDEEKTRYKKDIAAFEKAMRVQQALERYAHRHGAYPKKLAALLASDLRALPTWEGDYMLTYQPPKLFLTRRHQSHPQHD